MIPRDDERPNCIGLQVAGKYEEGRLLSTDAAPPKPGCLLELVAGETDLARLPANVRRCTVSATKVPPIICLEDRLGQRAGNITGRTIDTAYTASSETDDTGIVTNTSDIIPYVTLLPGDYVMARVPAHSDLNPLDYLTGNGNGEFVKGTISNAVLQVAEDVNWSAETASSLIRAKCV